MSSRLFAPTSDCPRCRFLVTQRGAVSFVTGRVMAVHDGGSVNRRHLGQSDVGANSLVHKVCQSRAGVAQPQVVSDAFLIQRHRMMNLTPGWKYEIMSAKKKTPKIQEIYAPKDVSIPSRLGGGVLKERVIRELPSKKVISYALAYINPAIYGGDNGRVLGYDNSHGFSHRHFMGSMTAEEFPGYEALYEKFETEWQQIAIKFVNGEQ